MSNQPVTGISKLAIMENISSNHLSIVSMLVGINCRLNAQDAILREIKEKLCGVNGDGSSETSDDDNNQGENEEEEERKLKIMAQLANDRFVPWVTLTENSKVQEENSPKEMATEIDEKDLIVCMDCNSNFKRGSGEFTRHLLTTRCRPYACNVCNKLFKKKSNMEAHKLTHHEDKLPCNECGAIFKCDQYLKNHQKRVHKLIIQETFDEEPAAKRIKVESIMTAADFDQVSFDCFMAQEMIQHQNAVDDDEP